ncbi:hypothetical protein [Providencia manganoxydans]|uniref:hypothetical protein n=1 Tax=Providencia manganoxydans TaxID=2923283 RepID=UPI0034E3A8A6
MIKNLLSLTERRLDRTLQEQAKLQSAIKALEHQRNNLQLRMTALGTQTLLYEQSAELNKVAFWERQRLKAALLAEIAHLQYQIESIGNELTKYEQSRKQIVARMVVLRNKCEKFRNYLKQQRLARCLKLERQQQNEIEELSVYGNNET